MSVPFPSVFCVILPLYRDPTLGVSVCHSEHEDIVRHGVLKVVVVLERFGPIPKTSPMSF